MPVLWASSTNYLSNVAYYSYNYKFPSKVRSMYGHWGTKKYRMNNWLKYCFTMQFTQKQKPMYSNITTTTKVPILIQWPFVMFLFSHIIEEGFKHCLNFIWLRSNSRVVLLLEAIFYDFMKSSARRYPDFVSNVIQIATGFQLLSRFRISVNFYLSPDKEYGIFSFFDCFARSSSYFMDSAVSISS